MRPHLFSPGEHDGNEPEILAAVLDELILKLHQTHTHTESIRKTRNNKLIAKCMFEL